MTANDIGIYLASLNLFVESDGKLYITVAGGDIEAIKTQSALNRISLKGRVPNDLVLELVALAENVPPPPATEG